jgi:hypothetical protein
MAHTGRQWSQNGRAYIHNALFVPTAPMGLLCPQQVAMQTRQSGDGFQALFQAGILIIAGNNKTITYDKRSCLPIMYIIDGAACYNAAVSTHIESHPSNLAGQQ